MSSQESTTVPMVLQFHEHTFRTYIDNHGIIWWVVQDVADVLGLQNLRQNLKNFPKDEKGVCHSVYTPGGPQEMLTVNEPGLYRLIFQSRKPEAHAVKRWVFHDVLPSLRRTGTYTMPGRSMVTPSNHLPPPPRYPMQERAHVSEHLLAVWTALRQAEEPISNAEIQATTRMKEGVTRKWTRYLVHIGLVDLLEMAPRHLFMVAEQADKRHAGYYQRLERLAAIMERRQERLYR